MSAGVVTLDTPCLPGTHPHDTQNPTPNTHTHTNAPRDRRTVSCSVCLSRSLMLISHVVCSQAMMVGCIPVIIADEIELPYENYLDWSQIAIKAS